LSGTLLSQPEGQVYDSTLVDQAEVEGQEEVGDCEDGAGPSDCLIALAQAAGDYVEHERENRLKKSHFLEMKTVMKPCLHSGYYGKLGIINKELYKFLNKYLI
jgi:hypothetical protein